MHSSACTRVTVLTGLIQISFTCRLLRPPLVSDKLSDVLLSAANADPSNAWDYTILHVIAYDGSYADQVEAAYTTLPDGLKDDTAVVVTVTDGNDDFVY